MLRKLLSQAGVTDAEAFSSHSLRRGFAQWAGMSGWDLRELMNYVGWRDVKAAMRYLDGVSTDQKARFEQGLDRALPETSAKPRRRNCPACPRSHRPRSRFPSICRLQRQPPCRRQCPARHDEYQPFPFSGAAPGQDRRRYQIPSRRPRPISWTIISTPCSMNSIALPMPVSVFWRRSAAIRPAVGIGIDPA
jgi:hypothetical protein